MMQHVVRKLKPILKGGELVTLWDVFTSSCILTFCVITAIGRNDSINIDESNMWLNISKGTSRWKTQFWINCRECIIVGSAMSKFLKLWSQGQFWNFTLFWNLPYLFSQVKTVFPCKNSIFIIKKPNHFVGCANSVFFKKSDFELIVGSAKSKFLKLWSQEQFWNFSYFGIFHTSPRKTVLCKNSIFMIKNPIILWGTPIFLPRFSNLRCIFLKIRFSPFCYDIINKIPISWEWNVQFQLFLHQTRAARAAMWEIAKGKKSHFWTSDPTGPFWCVESHNYGRYTFGLFAFHWW